MEILSIGPLELLFIILIALVILGPKDLEKTGRIIGQGLTKFIKSDTWKSFRQASDKVRSLPTELMREAGMEDMKKSLDSKTILPVSTTGKMLGSTSGESRVVVSAKLEKGSTEVSSGEPNKIVPPNPNK
jgi:Sec-independent protein translocase protein TatA